MAVSRADSGAAHGGIATTGLTGPSDASLIRLVGNLEEQARGYLTLAAVEEALGAERRIQFGELIKAEILLVDQRQRIEAHGEPPRLWTLCRLNHQHPLVRSALGSAPGD